jgi:hypothetical protein
MNPKATLRIGKMLVNAGFDVTRIPMWQLDGILLSGWPEEVKEDWAGNHEIDHSIALGNRKSKIITLYFFNSVTFLLAVETKLLNHKPKTRG